MSATLARRIIAAVIVKVVGGISAASHGRRRSAVSGWPERGRDGAGGEEPEAGHGWPHSAALGSRAARSSRGGRVGEDPDV
jgi:hypothetical protein